MAMTQLATRPEISADYDADADVLYVALGRPVQASCEDDENGLTVRYAHRDGRPCGVTVIGFRAVQWDKNMSRLSDLIAGHLGLDSSSVAAVLRGLGE